MQIGFRDLKDNRCLIDINTDNEGQFYQSLVSQFRNCVGLPVLDYGLDRQAKGPIRSQAEKIQPVCIVDEFYNSFEGYGISDFIKLGPKESFPAWRIQDVAGFIGHMKAIINSANVSSEDKEICKDIDAYVEHMGKYLDFLFKNSASPEALHDELIISPSDPEMFEQDTNTFREELQHEYIKIEENIEQIFKNRQIKKRVAAREAWEESACRNP